MSHMATVSIRELHRKTGDWVRRAAQCEEITVTDRGVPVALLRALPEAEAPCAWTKRKLTPAFKSLRKAGRLRIETDSAEVVSEDRDRGDDW